MSSVSKPKICIMDISTNFTASFFSLSYASAKQQQQTSKVSRLSSSRPSFGSGSLCGVPTGDGSNACRWTLQERSQEADLISSFSSWRSPLYTLPKMHDRVFYIRHCSGVASLNASIIYYSSMAPVIAFGLLHHRYFLLLSQISLLYHRYLSTRSAIIVSNAIRGLC